MGAKLSLVPFVATAARLPGQVLRGTGPPSLLGAGLL